MRDVGDRGDQEERRERGRCSREIVEPRRPGDVGGTFADVTKAKDLLDFEAKISLEEGVASVANWYNSDEYKKHFKR